MALKAGQRTRSTASKVAVIAPLGQVAELDQVSLQRLGGSLLGSSGHCGIS
jgi:hypothetical protein